MQNALPRAPLASPSRGTDSPVLTGPASFAFPPVAPTHPLATSTTSASLAQLDEPLPPPASTSRFHEALAAFPTSRHQPTSSTSSSSSSGSGTTFRFPPDSASPTSSKSFDVLQRELDSSGMDTGAEEEEEDRERQGRFDAFVNGDTTGDQLYDEPRSMGNGNQGGDDSRLGSGLLIDDVKNARMGSREIDTMAGIGRPASMDMGGDTSYDADTSFDFLLSPPPHLQALAASSNRALGEAPKAKEKLRERTFPAPLLLKGDRPFGGLGNTPPLAMNRMFGPSSESSPVGSIVASPISMPFRPPWSAGSNASISSVPSPSPSLASLTGPISAAESRPNPAFRRHRYQNSSTSNSSSYASQSYSQHSPHPSGSTAVSSPTLGSSSTLGYNHAHSSSNPVATPPAVVESAVTPQALLLYILSLRSTANPASSRTQHQRIRSAGSATSDNDDEDEASRSASWGRLDTVDLSHKQIAEVPLEVIEELRDEVEKLALGYNLLRDLPPHFTALGSKLRYLNVRVNMLTVFPQVLCEMPSLEILDISRNKIKRLPTNPGTLLNLKVFSIAKNRVKRLPVYFAQMSYLKVLKLDHNPLEWPPKDITAFPMLDPSKSGETEPRRSGSTSKVEDAEEMQKWLPFLLRWIRENAASADRRMRPFAALEQASDEERATRHGGELSQSRYIGMTRTESGRLIVSPALQPLATFAGPRPRGVVSPPGSALAAQRSPLVPQEESSRQHVRNASHSTTQNLQSKGRPGLSTKKSLPDLRQSHAGILADRMRGPSDSYPDRTAVDAAPQAGPPPNGRTATPVPTMSPSLPRSSSARAGANFGVGAKKFAARVPLPLEASLPLDERAAGPARGDETTGFDRNSGAYFRRLSMLPTSTISKTVPLVLLKFVDAIRGILFSLSQVYSALQQFVVFASQDRLPASLSRMLAHADRTMTLLINALDRFDSQSRRGTPEIEIVRNVFVTGQENVVSFHNLVTALGVALTTLVATADVRYTRTLLLMLYGSMGEIANSWKKITPLLEDMSTSPSPDPDSVSLASLIIHPPTPSPTLSTASSSRPSGIGNLYRARSKTRRHAGSFSVEDVQLGAVLPPALPGTPGSLAPPVPGLSALSIEAAQATLKPRGLRALDLSDMPALPLSPTHPSFASALANASPLTTLPYGYPASASPYSTPSFTSSVPPSAPSRSTSFGTASHPSLANSVMTAAGSDEFLIMVETTTTIAKSVYALLLSTFTSETGLRAELGERVLFELIELCRKGLDITSSLGLALSVVRAGGDPRRLGEESYAFVQTVIRFAKMVKGISAYHVFGREVREGVGQLTIGTREFAQHLSSSFRG